MLWMSECDTSTTLKKFDFYYNLDIMNILHVRDTVYTFIDTPYMVHFRVYDIITHGCKPISHIDLLDVTLSVTVIL